MFPTKLRYLNAQLASTPVLASYLDTVKYFIARIVLRMAFLEIRNVLMRYFFLFVMNSYPQKIETKILRFF